MSQDLLPPTTPTAIRVKQIIIEQLGVTDSECGREASIEDDLGADSLDKIDLIMKLENELYLTIPNEDVETIQTVGQLIDYIEARGVKTAAG